MVCFPWALRLGPAPSRLIARLMYAAFIEASNQDRDGKWCRHEQTNQSISTSNSLIDPI